MFELPTLAFGLADLEPYFDKETMELHYTKHHQAYINKLNAALEGHPDSTTLNLKDLLTNVDALDPKIRQAVINHGGGHHNHTLFWEALTPQKTQANGKFLEAVKSQFKSLEELQQKLVQSAAGVFGSGWGYLVADSEQKLQIITTPNQDSPLMQGLTPLLGVDVWEHAYYLKYQNRRPEYLDAFLKIINWEVVSDRYHQI